MNNKKGFTIIEVVLAFTFAVILLASMFVIVINYQNRVEKEKIVSNLLTYKNGILEIVYHDIISDNLKKMKVCDNNTTNCIEIETLDDKYKLESKIDNQGNKYLEYRGNNYVLPDSKNNLSKFGDFEYSYDENNKIFKVNIPVIHAELEDDENKENTIEIIVSGKEFDKEVTKLENPIIIKSIDALIYNDSNQELVSVQKQKGTVYYSMTEFLDGSNYNNKGSTIIPSKKDAGIYTVYYYVTGNNDYHPKSGTIEVGIGKRRITYKADDARKAYDGTPLSNGNATLISGALVTGHIATFEIEGTITTYGEVPNILKNVVIKNQNDVNVTNNYDITKVNGMLIIELLCEWNLTSTSSVSSCTSVNQPTSPSNNNTYVECDGPYYGNWRYSLSSGTCQHGAVIPSQTSGYVYSSSSSAINACNNSKSITCSGSYVKEGANCTTSRSVSYNKKEYTYQCHQAVNDTITISEKTATYTGSPISANNASVNSNGNILYEYYNSVNCSGQALEGSPVNVGNYSVKVSTSGDRNYLPVSVCVRHNVTKANPTVTLSPTSGAMLKGNTMQFIEKANVTGSFTNVSETPSVATLSPASYLNVSSNIEKTVTVTGKEIGSSIIAVTFTPSDTTNYNSITVNYTANIITKPVCTFTGPAASWIKAGATTTYTLNCTDTTSFSDSTLTSSDFTLSSSGKVTISTPTKSTITNGYRYVVTVTGAAQGTTNLTLKSGVLSNTAGGTNDAVTSSNVNVDTTLPTVSYSVAGGSYDTAKTITITASDTGGSEFNYMDVQIYKNGSKDESKSEYSRTTPTYSVTLEAGYSWTVYTRAYDKAGNKQSKSPENTYGYYYQDYTINQQTYTVIYNCNGGSGSTATSTHTYGVAKNLTNNGCYRVTAGTSGAVYSFLGWSTSSSATTATYSNGQSVTNLTTGSSITLYAVWKSIFTYSGSKNVVNEGNGNWKVEFKGNGTLIINVATNYQLFAVGGGGSGGVNRTNTLYRYNGAGGGGGGYTKVTTSWLNIGNYAITIGGGGAKVENCSYNDLINGNAGGTTSMVTGGTTIISASGGRGGNGSVQGGGAGGSGTGSGGKGGSEYKDAGNPYKGNNGALEFTTNSVSTPISGVKYYGAGGGGGGAYYNTGDIAYQGAAGGTTGGGHGGQYQANTSISGGAANTGAGGGGSGGGPSCLPSGAGGSGILMMRNPR